MVFVQLEDVFSDTAIEESLNYLEGKRDSSGPDGVALSGIRSFWDMNRDSLLAELMECRYQPGNVQMLEIVNYKGKKRTIAAHNSIDRLLLRCMAQGLQKEFDTLFLEHSYAFREGKGITAAANHVADLIRNGYAWSVRMDIRDYYGNIPLRELETLIQRELTDKRLFSLIQRYLHISIIQDGQIKPITKGIIQGSALSPLWGNLYLNALDRWLDSLAVAWCRYADDFLACFRTKEEADAFYPRLVRKLREDFSLEINQKKSGVVETVRPQFLGYSFHVSPDGKTVKVFRARQNPFQVYKDWNQTSIRKIDRDYHIISNGILTKKDYTLLFENEEGKRYIPVETMGALNIYSNAVFSGDFFRFAASRKLCINIFDKYGNAVGTFVPSGNGIIGKTMLKQAAIYLDGKKRMAVARAIEIGAFHNLRANLRYYARKRESPKLFEGIRQFSELIKELNEAPDIGAMMLVEARGRQLYYSMFNEIILQPGFAFTTRSRRPPKDALNALISFGNTYIYNRVASEIHKSALDIRIGFLHSTNSRAQSLNLDIAELFKPLIVDRAIFTLVNKRMIDADAHFEPVDGGGVFLTREGKRIFINALDEKLYQKYTVQNKPLSYDTRIREEVQALFRYVCYDEPYKPFKYY